MGLWDTIRDVVDPNSEADKRKRLAQGKSAQYIRNEQPVNPYVQQKVQNARYGVLANNQPRQNDFLKGIRPTNNSNLTAAKNIGSGIWNTDKAIYNGGKAAAGAIGNTAQLPFTAGRLGIANITGNKVAANNARRSAVSDAKNNMFWNESYNKTGNILAGAISGNYNLNKNKKANEKLNQTLRTAYGNRPVANAQIDAYTSSLNQEDNARFLGGYGLTPTSSKSETFKKVGLPIVSTGAQIALNGVGVGAGAKVVAGQAAKQTLRQQVNTVGKQGIGFGSASAGIAAADTLAAGGSNTDALKAGTQGFVTGAALPAAGFVGSKALKAPLNVARAGRETVARNKAAYDIEVNILRTMKDAENRAKGKAKITLRQQVLEQQRKLQRMKPSKQAGTLGIGNIIPEKFLSDEPAQTAPSPTIPKTKTQQAPPEFKTQVAAIPPDGTMTKTGGDMARSGGDVAIAQPKGKETKFASKTVPESEYVSEGVKERIDAPTYNPQTEKATYSNSAKRLETEGEQKFITSSTESLNKKPGTISRQEAADAQTSAALLDTLGDEASLQKATEIYERLSEHYTAAGQLVQAASIMSRRTPQGMMYSAVKTLKQAGVEITPELQTQLKVLVDNFAQAKDKTRAAFDVTSLVNSKIGTGVGDKAVNFWRAGLLTSPTTTAGNLLGNSGEALVRKGFVNPVATVADAVMGRFTGKRTQTLAPLGSATKGAKSGIQKTGEYIKSGYDERNVLSKYDAKEINYGDNAVGKAVSVYVNGTYRLMGVADQPFWYAAKNEALGSIARAEAINKGLKGAERSKFVREFTQNPPESALERANNEAYYATFQNKTTLGNIATGLKRSSGKFKPVADFFIPFTQVPSAIATRLVERTPIGTAHQIVKQIVDVRRGGQFDQRAMSQAIANGSFAPAVIGAGFAMAEAGQLTGAYPTDKKERALWESEGKQPNSFKVGDRWYSMNYLQPFGTIMVMGAQAANAKKEGKDTNAAITEAIGAGGKALTDQSFLKGISGVLDVIADPERSATRYVANTASSIVPNFIRGGARAADEVQRDPQGIKEGVMAGIPGLRGNVPVKTSITGDPLPAKDNFLNQYVNPLKPSKVINNDAIAELRRLQDAGQGVIPTEVTTNAFGKDSKFTKRQASDLSTLIAKGVSAEYAKVMKDPKYQALSDEDKKKALQKVSDVVGGVEKRKYAATNNLGEYSPTFDGKKTKLDTNQKRYAQGGTVDYFGETKQTPKEEYASAQEDYDLNKDTYSTPERMKKEKELKKLKVSADFDKDIVDFYGMTEKEVGDYLATTEEGVDKKAIHDKLIAYDKALKDAGIISKLKYKNGIARSDSGSGSGGRGKKPTFKIQQPIMASNYGLVSNAGKKIKAKKVLTKKLK
jgi:hypothetical protein